MLGILFIPAFLVIVDDLDVVRITVRPGNTHAPLIIDANAELARAITLQLFETVDRRNMQFLQFTRIVNVKQKYSPLMFQTIV